MSVESATDYIKGRVSAIRRGAGARYPIWVAELGGNPETQATTTVFQFILPPSASVIKVIAAALADRKAHV